MPDAKGTFKVVAWDESPYHESDGKKVTLAVVSQTFSGDVSGSGVARWLMAYRADGTARFVGLQIVEGTVAKRAGSFVLETAGDFDGRLARWRAWVVEGCGSGELSGLSGSGEFGAPHGSEATYELHLTL